MKLEKIPVGRITKAHGIRGEVRVLPLDGAAEELARYHTYYLDGCPVRPSSVRTHKGFALMRLPGVETMDEAEALRGKELCVSRSDGEIPAGRVFDAELLGMEVFDGENGTRLGEVTAVEPYPAGSVCTVEGERTYLIPVVKEAFLLRVDVEQNRMDVRVWEGMAVDED